MHIIIMGMGIFGLNLASLLISEGHDIVLIDNNSNKCTKFANKLDATIICGDGTDTEILEESGIRDADVFVAATENDDPNLLACVLAKGYEVPSIISQVSNINHHEAFKNSGIHSIINPELTAANFIKNMIVRPKISDFTLLNRGEAELINVVVEKGRYVNKKIGDISPNKNFNIIAIYQEDYMNMPEPEMILEPGMKISLLVKTEHTMDVLKGFTEETDVNIFPGIKIDLYQELINRKIIK